MCKKIAIVGSHSCGKTTTVYKLAAALKELDYSVAVSVEVARICPYPLYTKEGMEWIILTQIKQELELSKGHQFVICDRSSIDSVMYAKVSGVELCPNLVRLAKEHLNSYDRILHLHPTRPIVDDGFRNTDEDYRTRVYEEFKHMFPYSSNDFKIGDII